LAEIAKEKILTTGGSALGVAAKKLENVGKMMEETGAKLHHEKEELTKKAEEEHKTVESEKSDKNMKPF